MRLDIMLAGTEQVGSVLLAALRSPLVRGLLALIACAAALAVGLIIVLIGETWRRDG